MHERVGLAQAGNHIIQQATPIKEYNPKDNSKVPTQKWTHENVSRNMAGLNQEMCPGNKDFAWAYENKRIANNTELLTKPGSMKNTCTNNPNESTLSNLKAT